MHLWLIGTRRVATVGPTASAVEVARAMEDRRVGSVVVVADGRPIGIVTDRDLVLRLVVPGRSPTGTTAAEVMSSPAVTVPEDADVHQASLRMREHRIRRLPIVEREGRLVGILTFDDLVNHLGRSHLELAELLEWLPVPRAGG